jgi:hypothetical protein
MVPSAWIAMASTIPRLNAEPESDLTRPAVQIGDMVAPIAGDITLCSGFGEPPPEQAGVANTNDAPAGTLMHRLNVIPRSPAGPSSQRPRTPVRCLD